MTLRAQQMFCSVGKSTDGTEKRKGMDIQVGDIITMKKPHPCGSKDWEVLRVGADFRLKCMGCDHQVMLPRRMVEKNVRHIVHKDLPSNS